MDSQVISSERIENRNFFGGQALTWLSVGADHAIERVRYEVQFSEPLPKKIVQDVGILHDEKAAETRFGPRQPQQVAQFVLGPTGNALPAAKSANEVGWLSTRTQGVAHNVVEALSVQNSLLSYESSDYKGWSKSLARFETLCGNVIRRASELVNAASVTLEYYDRFVFEGEPASAKPDGLLHDDILSLLPESAASGRELWHVHRGWFETLGLDRCLVNQNFDAQQGQMEFGRELRSIQVFTKCHIQVDGDGFQLGSLSDKLDRLHKRSLELFSMSLKPAMATKIGLKGDL